MLNAKKLFITGATGFLGGVILREAVKQGYHCLCLRRSSSISRFSHDIEAQIQWVNTDAKNWREQVSAFQPEVLIHAAWGGVRGGNNDVEKIQQANVELSQELFRLYDYKQIIAFGSQAEYGYYEKIVSEDDPLNPITAYGKAKCRCCEDLQNYCKNKAMQWQWIRVFTIFGGTQKAGLITSFVKQCFHHFSVFDTTAGMQQYAYLYEADFVKAVMSIINIKGHSGIYNLSNPFDIYSNKVLLEMIKEEIGSTLKINFGALPYSPYQIMYMQGATYKFEQTFGKIPHTPFKEALKETINIIKHESI